MMSTERLGKTTDRVKDSRRLMIETEEIGVSLLQDLHSQRQSLLRAGDTVFALSTILSFTPESRFSTIFKNLSDKKKDENL